MPDQLSNDLASLKIDRGASRGQDRPPRARILRGGLIAAAILGGLYLAYDPLVDLLRAQVLQPEVQITEIRSVSPGQVRVELTSSGYVVPQVIARVGAKLAGRVQRVHGRQGQRVDQGDLLLELDRSEYDAAVQAGLARTNAAIANVHTARAELAEVRVQLDRKRALAEQGAVRAADVEDLSARMTALSEMVKAAQAEVRAAAAETATQRVNLESMELHASISGTVTNKPPEVGELINPGGAVVELSDFDSFMVESDVPESRLHMVRVGAPCEIALDAFPERRFRGEAAEILPQVDRAKATVVVKVEFLDSTEGVLPDMAARVSFLDAPLDKETLQEPSKTVVPKDAVVERAGADVVFVVDGGRVRMTNVVLGDPMSGGFELVSGPDPGTAVVSGPPPDLKDGQRIKEKGAS